MGVKIVKGVAGTYGAVKSPAQQLAQSKNSPGTASKAAQSSSILTDAAISLVRGGGRPDGAERLTLDKAEKVAKGLKKQILEDSDTALDAIGQEFSISAVRDAFGV